MSLDETEFALVLQGWMSALSLQMMSLTQVPDVFHTAVTDARRADFQDFVARFQKKVTYLHGMVPPPRFRPSYEKCLEAAQTMSSAFDEIRKQLSSAGSGSEQKANDAVSRGEEQFAAAADLFNSETGAGSPMPSTTP